MAAEMMSGDLPVTSDADAMAKQRAKEAELAAGGTMLASGSTKRKADQVRARAAPCSLQYINYILVCVHARKGLRCVLSLALCAIIRCVFLSLLYSTRKILGAVLCHHAR